MAIIDPKIGGQAGVPSAPGAVAPTANIGRGILGSIEGLARLNSTFNEKEKRENDLASAQLAVRQRGAYRRRAEEILRQHDATAPDYMDRVTDSLAEAREEVSRDSNITSLEIQEKLDLDLAELEQGSLLAAQLGRTGALEKKAVVDFDGYQNEAFEAIRDNPDAADAIERDLAKTFAGLAPSMSEENRLVLAEGVKAGILEAKVEGLIADTRFDEALALIDEQGGTVDPGNRRRLTSMVAQGVKALEKDASIAFAREIADVEIATAAAETVEQMDDVLAHIGQMDRVGKLEGKQSKRASLYTKALNKRARIIEKGDDLRDAFKDMEADLPLTPEQTDLLAPEFVKQAQAEGLDEVDTLVELAGHGNVPTELKKRLKAAEQANKPEALVGAVELHRRLSLEAPGAPTGVKDGGRIELVDTLSRVFGMEPLAAAEMVINQAPDEASREARGEAWDALDISPEEIIADTPVAPDISFLPFTIGQEIPPEALADANRYGRQAYIATGDVDAAEAMVVTGMQKTWGMSAVGVAGIPRSITRPEFGISGVAGALEEADRQGIGFIDLLTGSEAPIGRIMKYPPEAHFPAIYMDEDRGIPTEVRTQITDELFRAQIQAEGWPEEVKTYELVPTPDAERRLAAGLPLVYHALVPTILGGQNNIFLSHFLDDGTRELTTFVLPKDELDLKRSKTFREWAKKRDEEFRRRLPTDAEVSPLLSSRLQSLNQE